MDNFVKIPIFPTIKYMPLEERVDLAAPMVPVSFMFGENEIHVGVIRSCVRGVSRKTGGRGFRYACQVSWQSDGKWRLQESVLWYDDFLQEWFVEVPETRAPAGWYTATRINDLVS